MHYVRLPPPRESLPHTKVIAVLLAAVIATVIVDAARAYHRPLPPTRERPIHTKGR